MLISHFLVLGLDPAALFCFPTKSVVISRHRRWTREGRSCFASPFGISLLNQSDLGKIFTTRESTDPRLGSDLKVILLRYSAQPGSCDSPFLYTDRHLLLIFIGKGLRYYSQFFSESSLLRYNEMETVLVKWPFLLSLFRHAKCTLSPIIVSYITHHSCKDF